MVVSAVSRMAIETRFRTAMEFLKTWAKATFFEIVRLAKGYYGVVKTKVMLFWYTTVFVRIISYAER